MDDIRSLKSKMYLDIETEVIPIANRNQIFDREEILEMLSLFHRLGIFVFVSKTPTLSSRVITQPKWLLENLTKLIRDPIIHVSEEERKQMKMARLKKDFDTLLTCGQVSQKLINKLLPVKDLEYIVEFMEQTLLLCRLGKDCYSIPSMASNDVLKCPTNVDGFKFWMQFEYLPDGLVQRWISLCVIDQSESINFMKPVIHRSTAVVRIGTTDVYCEAEGNALVFRFSKRGDVLKLRNQIYQLTKIIVQKFLGETKPPTMFLVPSGFEDGPGPLVGQSFEMVKSFRDTKTEISLTNTDFVDVSKFDAFFEISKEYESIELGDFDTFLSHAWGKDDATHKQVERIAQGLKEQNVSPWLDSKQMIGVLGAAMADGIDHSKSMTIFITEEYMNKVNGKGPKGSADNCLAEFTYGGANGFDFLIPVLLEKKMGDQKLWTGTFGVRIGKDQKYIDLTDNSKFDANVKDLAIEIKRRSS